MGLRRLVSLRSSCKEAIDRMQGTDLVLSSPLLAATDAFMNVSIRVVCCMEAGVVPVNHLFDTDSLIDMCSGNRSSRYRS